MQSKSVDVGERRADAQAGVPFRRALVAVFVFYMVAAVLNGRALNEGASERPYGPVRDVWVGATAPLHWLSTTLRMDRLRSFFESFLEVD